MPASAQAGEGVDDVSFDGWLVEAERHQRTVAGFGFQQGA